MKKILVILLTFASTIIAVDDSPFTPANYHLHRFFFRNNQLFLGRSYMFTQPAYMHFCMYYQGIHDLFLRKNGTMKSGLHAIGFYQHSISWEKDAWYFLINCKSELLVSGDINIGDTFVRDVRAEWLNLPHNFRGRFSINPKQRQAGCLIEYHQDLIKFFEGVPFLEDSWLSISAVPVLWVQNDMNFKQFDMVNTGTSTTGPNNLCQAFNQQAWCFGKIDGTRNRTRPAEIRLMLGKTYLSEHNFEIAYYSALTVPLGNKPTPCFLFDSVVGNGQHVGIGAGAQFQLVLNRAPSLLDWCFYFGLESIFLIRNTQLRTYDLVNKPWSRYMQYNRRNGPPNENIPGVNVLTLKTRVKQFGLFDFTMGMRVKTAHFEYELGYNIWGHSQEQLYLRDEFISQCRPEIGIAGVGALNPTAPLDRQVATTSSFSTIGTLAPNDVDPKTGEPVFVGVRVTDIDLTSAAAGSAINHTLNTAVTFINKGTINDALVGAGFLIAFPQRNGSLFTWTIWAKAAVTF